MIIMIMIKTGAFAKPLLPRRSN